MAFLICYFGLALLTILGNCLCQVSIEGYVKTKEIVWYSFVSIIPVLNIIILCVNLSQCYGVKRFLNHKFYFKGFFKWFQ